MVPRQENPAASARLAQSTTWLPVAPGIVVGRPMPIFMRVLLSYARPVTLDELPGWAGELLSSARVGRLALLDERDLPRVLPVVFAVWEGAVWSAIDRKPKRSAEPARVRRVTRSPGTSRRRDRCCGCRCGARGGGELPMGGSDDYRRNWRGSRPAAA